MAETPIKPGVLQAVDFELQKLEALCARALAGDQDKRTLVTTLRLIVERTQQIRSGLNVTEVAHA